jgi:hypothetical protein
MFQERPMTGPAWLAPALAAVMLLIAVGSLVRLTIWRLRGRAAEPEVDALHALMGVAMAGILEPRISLVPDTARLALFSGAAAWFAWRPIRVRSQRRQAGDRRSRPARSQCSHPAPHAAECAAMIYMLMPTVTSSQAPTMAMPGMTGPPPTANPALAFILALFMIGYIVWTADRLTSQSRALTRATGRRLTRGPEPGGPQPAAAAEHGAATAALAPRAAACSKIAMSVAMAYMLLTML